MDDRSFSTVASSNNDNAETNLDGSADNPLPTSATSATLTSNGLPLIFPTSASSTLIPSKFSPKFENYITILNNDLSTLNHSIESDSENIWEELNSKCHRKFGYGSKIKQHPNEDDLNWTINILPIYAKWDKLMKFKSLIELWISKVNQHMQEYDVILTSSSPSISLSPISTSVPLSFAPLVKGKKVRINEDIEINVLEDENTQNEDIEINVEDENTQDEDVETNVKGENNQSEDVENEDKGICLYFL